MRKVTKLLSAAIAGIMGTTIAAKSLRAEDTTKPAKAKHHKAGKAHNQCKAGANACKGKGACKNGNNGCAGKNSCKGKGGGAVPVKASHSCKGQNECKGKGGCKTDKHACKGQNDCKGQGGCGM